MLNTEITHQEMKRNELVLFSHQASGFLKDEVVPNVKEIAHNEQL